MAHTKAQKSARGNKDSISKRLGVKIYGGQIAAVGNIIIRQKGSRVKTGTGVKMGRDFTIYATTVGKVAFKRKLGRNYVSVVAS